MSFFCILKAYKCILSFKSHKKLSTFLTSNFSAKFSTNFESDIRVQGLSLKNYLVHLEREYQSLSNDNSKSSIIRKLEIEPAIHILSQRKELLHDLKNLNDLLNSKDEALRELAEQEKQEFETQLKQLNDELLSALIPKDKEEYFDTIFLEVQAGVGGQEAMLFAKEVFDMYKKYADYKGCFILLNNLDI